MFKLFASFAVLLAAGLFLGGCATAPETPNEQRSLHDDVQATMRRMFDEDPGLREVLDKRAYGYAVFPSIGQGGFIVGGAYGRGEVYEQARLVGYAELQQANIGALVGGHTFSQLIVFITPEAFNEFKRGSLSAAADASAVALKAGAAAGANFRRGWEVFTLSDGGLIANLSLAGQKYNYQPLSQVQEQMRSNTGTDGGRVRGEIDLRNQPTTRPQ